MSTADPFALIGLAPTLDKGELKRAYFRALALHPPHQDPEGFRQLRQAYEELSRPGRLAAAYLARPLDLRAELAPYAERFDAPLSAALESRRSETERALAVDRFIEMASRPGYAEALKKFAP